jgi:hypothetical protein
MVSRSPTRHMPCTPAGPVRARASSASSVAGTQPNSPSLTISRSALAQPAWCTRSTARSIGACTSVPPSKPWPIRSSAGGQAVGAGRASSLSTTSSGPPKAISRQPRRSPHAPCAAPQHHRLGDGLGRAAHRARRVQAQMIGPRSSASGWRRAVPGAAAPAGRGASGPAPGRCRSASSRPRHGARATACPAPDGAAQRLAGSMCSMRGRSGCRVISPGRPGRSVATGFTGWRRGGACGLGGRGAVPAPRRALAPAQAADQRSHVGQPRQAVG